MTSNPVFETMCSPYPFEMRTRIVNTGNWSTKAYNWIYVSRYAMYCQVEELSNAQVLHIDYNIRFPDLPTLNNSFDNSTLKAGICAQYKSKYWANYLTP